MPPPPPPPPPPKHMPCTAIALLRESSGVTRNSRDALLKKLMERRTMAADQIDTNCAAASFQRMDGFRSRNSKTPTLQHRANVTEMPLMYGGELSTHHVLVDAGLELPSIVLEECLGKVLRGARHAGEVCDHLSLLLGKIPHCSCCPPRRNTVDFAGQKTISL